MERNIWFFRLFFFALSCFIATGYELSCEKVSTFWCFLKGITTSIVTCTMLLGIEHLFKKRPLRVLTTAAVGLFVGTLIALVTAFSIQSLFSLIAPNVETSGGLILFTYLSCIYLGIMLTVRSSENWWLNIPFVQLSPQFQGQNKEILVSPSALEDGRLLDLARSGLLNQQLVVATFIIEEIKKSIESADEQTRNQARKRYDLFKRLENIPLLGLQIKEYHLNDTESLDQKLFAAAKLSGSTILSSHDFQAQLPDDDDVPVISLEAIATALKPAASRGETLDIKIQRLGKEPKQGIGYLDDGTMVVINGGGDYLGKTISTQVLSQKYSSSGKIIFCNAVHGSDKIVQEPELISV